MGARERKKGQRGENELAALLSDELGIPIKRMLGQERDGGADLHVGPLRIQVKRCETIKLAEWWRQACADADGGIPVLAYRASRRPWAFRMNISALLGELEWDTSDAGYDWVEMPIGSFAFWVRENIDLSQPDA
jgi:hypothetical protein